MADSTAGRGEESSVFHLSEETPDPQQPLLDPLDDEAPLNEAIDALRMIVMNEQFSPEILPYQADAVDGIRDLVAHQTNLVDDEEDDPSGHTALSSQLKRLELDRVNYLLRHYLRLRIKKVEKFVFLVFKEEDVLNMLSDAEKRFARGYKQLVDKHFNQSFLSMLPTRLQIMEKDGTVDHVTQPVLDSFVFCRVRQTIGRFAIGEDSTEDALELTEGDVLCVRYKSIRDLLTSEDVELL